MKKKLFAMYALVGALVASPVFTSCIDDTESASVTAVRTQKAEAMRIANQIAAANAELQIQRDKLALEKDIANYEQNIANYEALLLQYQLQIKQNQEALDNFGVVALSTLTYNYTNALSNIANSEWNIVKYNQQIEALKGDFLGEQEYVVKETERLNALIAGEEAKIAEAKALQEAGLDKSTRDEKIKELNIAKQKASKEYQELVNKYGENAKNTATGKALQDLYTIVGQANYEQLITYDAEGNPILVETKLMGLREYFSKANATIDGTVYDAYIVLPYYMMELGTEADTEKTTYAYESAPLTEYPTMYAQLAIDNKNLTAANELLAKLEKALEDAKAALEANTDETKTAELEGKVTTALNLLTTYKADTADESTTDYDGNAETTEMGYACALNAVKVAESAILSHKDKIQILEIAIAKAEKNSEAFEAAIATFAGEDYEAYLTALAELTAANTAKTEAEAAHSALVNLYNSYNDGIYTVYDKYYDNYGNQVYGWVGKTTSEYIEYCENQINGYKEEIANLEAVVDYNNVEANSEESLAILIAYIEKQIAIEEVKLATYQKQAEEAKAALDAYLAE